MQRLIIKRGAELLLPRSPILEFRDQVGKVQGKHPSHGTKKMLLGGVFLTPPPVHLDKELEAR